MKANENWPVQRLSDVCLKIQDGTHFSPKVQYNDPAPGRFKYVTSKNIRPWGLDLSDVSYVAEETHREIYGRCDPQVGDVLLTKDGANTGTVALNMLDEPFSLLSSVAVLRPRADILDARFLRYFIESPQGSRNILGRMSGTAIRRIILRQIKDATIPLPPLDEQRRIVAEIEKQFTRLDSGMASLKRVQTALERYRASVLKAACEGRLVPTEAELAQKENRSCETAEELLQRILQERRDKWNGKGRYKEPATANDAELPSLPEGWTWTTVEKISNVVRGASPRPAGDPKYFGGTVSWITVGPITADESAYLKSVPETVTKEGRERSRYIGPHTLLLTNSGATLGVPKISLIGGCINDGVAALLDVDYPLKLYLLYFLRTQTKSLRGVNQGAAQPNLNTTIIKAIKVPLPPLAEQRRIVVEIERRLSVIEELEAVTSTKLRRATRLRQSILQRAFVNGGYSVQGHNVEA